jgi:hypothetical protein
MRPQLLTAMARLPPSLAPPPADSLQVFQISSLAAALVKLNIGIPVEDVIEAVQREDEAKRATLTAQPSKRRTTLSKRNSTPLQSLHSL